MKNATITYKGKPINMSFWDFVKIAELDKLPTPKQCKLNEKLPSKSKERKHDKPVDIMPNELSAILG